MVRLDRLGLGWILTLKTLFPKEEQSRHYIRKLQMNVVRLEHRLVEFWRFHADAERDNLFFDFNYDLGPNRLMIH